MLNSGKGNQGRDFLYYSTAYAKMLFGWNHFEEVMKCEEGLKAQTNPLVRTVPIDPTLKKKTLALVISKLDGVIFTGGNCAFYQGIDQNKICKDSPFAKMTQQELMREFVKHAKNKGPNPLTRKKTRYFQGLCNVLQQIRLANRQTPSKKIPILAICLGFEGILLEAAGDMRLESTSDKNQYHDTVLVTQKPEGDPFTSFNSFLHGFYKNKSFFPSVERNAYFFHSKMITPKSFNAHKSLSQTFQILAVSYTHDQGKNNSDFKDLKDWIEPQTKQLVVFPSNTQALDQKICKGHKIFFSKARNPKIKPDFRLQFTNHFPMIYRALRLVKVKLKEDLTEDLRQNYLTFLQEANAHLDLQLNRKNLDVFWRKKINTDHSTYSEKFVSIVEGKHDPIYGLQFHPEKSFYNFHRNQKVKTASVSRAKDQLLIKFFLKKVFEEKISSFETKSKKDIKFKKQAQLLKQICSNAFSHSKLLPHLQKNSSFNLSWLSNNSEGQPKVNSNYNNILAQQIIRDFDQFYSQIFPELSPFQINNRFIIRGIGTESEALVYSKF